MVRISDLHPDPVLYRSLEADFPGLIVAALSPQDLSTPISPDPQTLLVISGSFHHIPFPAREKILKLLIQHHVAIFEPLRPNGASFLVSMAGFFPAIAAPVIYMMERRAGHWRRLFWCWMLPVVPLIIIWEGWVSCWRCWNEKDWRRAFVAAAGKDDARLKIELLPLSQRISW